LRKRSIDLNLSKLKKELTEIIKKKEMMERKYAEKIKQIEIAETEIETMNKDIIRVNIRYQRRELSTEAHKRLVEKYRRIKEQAENTIAETLLRLREDLH
jgi:lipopolysaccharide biosynthesis regulator YciM